jgi:hypothetical protein
MYSIQYTAVPPASRHCKDMENKDDAMVGARVLIVEAVICASPFVDPKASGLGDSLLKDMNMQPWRFIFSRIAVEIRNLDLTETHVA